MRLSLKLLTDNGSVIYVISIYLLFIGNTFNEDDFDTMIYDAIKNREQKIIDKNSMEINVESRIANAINNSQFISSKFTLTLKVFSFKR